MFIAYFIIILLFNCFLVLYLIDIKMHGLLHALAALTTPNAPFLLACVWQQFESIGYMLILSCMWFIAVGDTFLTMIFCFKIGCCWWTSTNKLFSKVFKLSFNKYIYFFYYLLPLLWVSYSQLQRATIFFHSLSCYNMIFVLSLNTISFYNFAYLKYCIILLYNNEKIALQRICLAQCKFALTY